MDMKKQKEQNKSLYITMIVILVALAVAVAVTSVVSKKADESGIGETLQANEEKTGEENGEPVYSNSQDTNGQTVFKDKTQDETNTQTDPENEVEGNGADGNEASSEAASEAEAAPPQIPDTEAPETEAADVEEPLPEFSSPIAAGYVISGHSESVPVFSITMNDYRTHTGVDISAQQGEAVLAAADGVIGAIYEDPMMGTCMTVVHSGGAVSTYKGLYGTIPDGIVQGAEVTKGQPIAAVGDTALAEVAEESHVHYELAIDGVNVDPCLYIEFSEDSYEY